MKPAGVLEVLDILSAAGVRAWLDGGWGVDALLGKQTRDHADLDLVIDIKAVAAAQAALRAGHFAIAEDELPTRFVMAGEVGRRIDFPPVAFDAAGGGVQTLQDGSTWRYPPEGFAGVGRIAGREVPCLTPEVQLLCHLGYEPDADDRHDVRLLCARFGLALPEGY